MKLVREQIVKLNGAYTALLDLAREKTGALKGGDYEKVGGITQREEKLIERAKALEEERMQAVKVLAEQWGVAPGKITAAALIAKCGEADAAAMEKEIRALSQTLEALRAQNEINGRLLDIKMKLASFILDASREAAKDPGNYYNNDGTELQKEEITRPRFIDSEI